MSLLDYDGLDYHTGKFKTWVKKLLEGKSNAGHKHTKSDITDFPNLGTASVKDVASTGNASTTQVVMGNDTRLSDARKANDVYDWAKSSTKPTYTASEVGADPSGSASSALTSANGYTDTVADTKVDKIDGKGLSTNDLTDTLKSTYDTAVNDVNTLKGTGEGSVSKTVTDEIAKVVANAPEDLDTLKEISDWINGHEDSAAAMNTAIQNKVDKVQGKGLSTNDLTNELKTKYDENIENLNNSIRSVYSITKNLCNVQEGYILVNSSKQLITGMYLDSGDYVLSFNSDSSDGTYTIETVNDDMSNTGDMTIDDGTANIKSGKNTKTFHIIGSAKIAISSTVETELYNMQIEAGTSATSYDDYIDSLWSLTSGVAGIRKTMVDKTDLDTVNNSLLSLITHNTNYVENFSGDETADNAPMGIRKGMTVEGYPEIFGEWVLYKTYYYDTEHQYGWQTAYDMNASRIAYRYRRNGSWFEWNYLNDVKTVDFNGTKYLFTFKAGDDIDKDITDDVRVKNNPYFALDVTNVNNIGLNIEFLTGETSQKEITVYKSLEKDGEVCDTFVYNFKPSSTHKSEYLNINVSGDSGYIYFKLSNTGGTGWNPKITSIALNNSAGGQSSINSYSNKVDYTISADYESIISKRENFSYKTNNIVTLNFSIKVAGDIAANKEIVRVSPIPKNTIYCFIHDAYNGTVIPAYIDVNGILKIRKAVSLDGSYNVSATYGV